MVKFKSFSVQTGQKSLNSLQYMVEEGLERLPADDPHVVVTDLKLGGPIDGLDVLASVVDRKTGDATTVDAVHQQRVEAGNAAGSALQLRVTADGFSIMPPTGSLDPADLALIETWIEEGALDN